MRAIFSKTLIQFLLTRLNFPFCPERQWMLTSLIKFQLIGVSIRRSKPPREPGYRETPSTNGRQVHFSAGSEPRNSSGFTRSNHANPGPWLPGRCASSDAYHFSGLPDEFLPGNTGRLPGKQAIPFSTEKARSLSVGRIHFPGLTPEFSTG